MTFKQRGNAIRGLCALPDPVVCPIEIDPQIFLMLLANRIEKTDPLQVAAVPTIATIVTTKW